MTVFILGPNLRYQWSTLLAGGVFLPQKLPGSSLIDDKKIIDLDQGRATVLIDTNGDLYGMGEGDLLLTGPGVVESLIKVNLTSTALNGEKIVMVRAGLYCI